MFSASPSWSSRRALYEYFLVDVDLEGCARTSWVVAAISSVQLYVYRVLMHLEQNALDPNDPNYLLVTLDPEPAKEWGWRQNFRVWQANRKVFLFAESYIEPELRDDKTPLFKDLETELKQKDINYQSVLDAHGKYVSGFRELANLAIAGVYHEVGDGVDTLHLFGASHEDPPVYYYRTVDDAIAGETDAQHGVVWGPWQKITVQISARRVAPLVIDGLLYVFWVDIRTMSANQVDSGSSKFVGYRHKMTVKYTTLRSDGQWSPPQPLTIVSPDTAWLGPGQGVIFDALDSQSFPALDPSRPHTEPIDGYTLQGPAWESVVPELSNGALQLAGRNSTAVGSLDLFTRNWSLNTEEDPCFTAASLRTTGSTQRSLRRASAAIFPIMLACG